MNYDSLALNTASTAINIMDGNELRECYKMLWARANQREEMHTRKIREAIEEALADGMVVSFYNGETRIQFSRDIDENDLVVGLG